jgi:hypothetical protein
MLAGMAIAALRPSVWLISAAAACEASALRDDTTTCAPCSASR